jgi:hypothetical protein
MLELHNKGVDRGSTQKQLVVAIMMLLVPLCACCPTGAR